MDPQLITAIAALITSAATLAKVLQHDGIIRTTATDAASSRRTIERVSSNTDGTLIDLSAHLSSLAAAASAFANSNAQNVAQGGKP